MKADLRPIVREKIADSLKAGNRDAERRPHHHLTREDDGVEYVTRYERFILGDFPMVCPLGAARHQARTGRNPTGIAVALIGVILKGVHPEFVRATRHAQGKDDR